MVKFSLVMNKTKYDGTYCKNNEGWFYYIGSTNNFTKRYNSHKSHCNNENDHNHNFVHWDGAERGYP